MSHLLVAAGLADPTPAACAAECTDHYPRCYVWAHSQRLCDSALREFMATWCRASCGLCVGSVSNPCAAATNGGGDTRAAYEAFEHTPLSSDPPVVRLDQLVDAEEGARWARAAVDFGLERTVHCIELDECRRSDAMQDLEARLLGVLDVPRSRTEGLKLFRFRAGEAFQLQHHQPTPVAPSVPGGARTWSASVWLTSAEGGGAVRFPRLGVEVPARAGVGWVWRHGREDGGPDERAEHLGDAVLEGDAVGATVFAHSGHVLSLFEAGCPIDPSIRHTFEVALVGPRVPPLHWAAMSDRPADVARLLAAGADVDEASAEGDT